MSLIYTEADYNGNYDSGYHDYFYLQLQTRLTSGRLNALKNQKILIAGCAYGYTVRRLMAEEGFLDVWGCDASTYAVNRAQTEITPYGNRVRQADVTIRQQINSLRSSAGLSGNARFSTTVTEDLLPCAESIAEVQTMLTELRRVSQVMMHIITLPESRYITKPGFLWLSAEEWRGVIGNGEVILAYRPWYGDYIEVQ